MCMHTILKFWLFTFWVIFATFSTILKSALKVPKHENFGIGFLAKKTLWVKDWEQIFNFFILYLKFIKINVLIHTRMIVVRVGCLCIRLAYIYESYTYDSPTGMNNIRKLIVLVDFSHLRHSYAYETDSYIFTSPFDVDANHTHRICTRTQIICKRFMVEAYANN